MKKLVLAATFATFAYGAMAGGMDEPVMEEPIMAPPVEEMAEDSSTPFLPILLFLALAVFASS